MFTEESNVYWKKFSEIIEADFEERKYWHSAKSIKNYKNFQIVFDNYMHNSTVNIFSIQSEVTRVCCLFESKFDLTFKLIETNFFDKALTGLSGKTVKTQDRTFNSDYIITSKNKQETESIFRDSKIRESIRKIKSIHLEIGTNEGIWGNELTNEKYELSVFLDKGNLDYDVLKNINRLFELFLDKLVELYHIKPCFPNK